MKLERKVMLAGAGILTLGIAAAVHGFNNMDARNSQENYIEAVGGIITGYVGITISMMSYFHERYKLAVNKNKK
jgi:hypothetical protein